MEPTTEVPIIDELIARIKEKLASGKLLPKSKLREALGYFCSLIPYLKNYTLHPTGRLDNNTAERAIRPLAIGRKNWLFVGSEGGALHAALLARAASDHRQSVAFLRSAEFFQINLRFRGTCKNQLNQN